MTPALIEKARLAFTPRPRTSGEDTAWQLILASQRSPETAAENAAVLLDLWEEHGRPFESKAHRDVWGREYAIHPNLVLTGTARPNMVSL